MTTIQKIRHKLIPNWARKIYYDRLYVKRYNDMLNMPECEYEDYLCRRYEEMLNRSERTQGLHMDFDDPVTYSQKMQWMKLYDLSEEKTLCSDKYAVREYIARKLGEEYLIPLVTIDGKDCFHSASEIEFDKLPNSFVMKCNHGSHYNIIVKDKSRLTAKDIKNIKRKLNTWLREKYEFKVGLELYYKGIDPVIIIEKYMEMDDDLPDYKFYCFDGEVKFVFCMEGRQSEIRQSYFDKDFKKLPFVLPFGSRIDFPDVTFGKPENYEKMLEIAELLSKGFSHVRVDLYNLNGKIYFGELTFCSASGYEVAHPMEYDRVVGDWIKIDQSKREGNYRYRMRNKTGRETCKENGGR